MSNEKLKDGDRVILTGWKQDLNNWRKNFIKGAEFCFPKEVQVSEHQYKVFIKTPDSFFVQEWDLELWFEYKTISEIQQITTDPVFTTVTPDQMQFICQKFGLSTSPGVQPGTIQAVLCAPDGTSSVFFICHTSPVNVTVYDNVGDMAVTIHDKI